MKLSCFPSQLNFRFLFSIAHGMRTHTDVVYVRIQHNECTAWGEATLPPYLGVSKADVIDAVDYINHNYSDSNPLSFINNLQHYNGCMPARAAVDMALWYLRAKFEQTSVLALLNVSGNRQVPHSYTIAHTTDAKQFQKAFEHGYNNGYRFFKLKLINEDVFGVVKLFRALTDLPFAVDANQAWRNLDVAVEIAAYLKGEGCEFIEQPFPVKSIDVLESFHQVSSLPVFVDESCQRLNDVELLYNKCSGVNIKLMKCGGVTEALRMIEKARSLQMKILIGCMSESSVGCRAGEWLAPLCDYADLDGRHLITNDFEESKIVSSQPLL